MKDIEMITYMNKLVDYLLPDGSSIEKFNLTNTILENSQLRLSVIVRNKESIELLKQAILYDPEETVKLEVFYILASNPEVLYSILKTQNIGGYLPDYLVQEIMNTLDITEQLLLDLMKSNKNIDFIKFDVFDATTKESELNKIASNEVFPIAIRIFALSHIKNTSYISECQNTFKDFSDLFALEYNNKNSFIHFQALSLYFNTNGTLFKAVATEKKLKYLEYILRTMASKDDNSKMKALLKLATDKHMDNEIMLIIKHGILNLRSRPTSEECYNILLEYIPETIKKFHWKSAITKIRGRLKYAYLSSY